jgi:hypothetical protein
MHLGSVLVSHPKVSTLNFEKQKQKQKLKVGSHLHALGNIVGAF